MPSLMLIIFLVELAVQTINSIGATTISDALWKIYNYTVKRRSSTYAEQRKLQADYVNVRRELNATSSQDEFAKWARLRRQHDKLLEQLEKKKNVLDAGRRTFDSYVNVIRLVLTRGLQYFLPFWFARTPMFWLPHGWFPAYAEWLLAFPRAPRGSVSIASWQLACLGVLTLLRDTIQAFVTLFLDWRAVQQEKKAQAAKEKQKTKTKEAPVAAEAAATEKGSKKEL